MVRNVCFRAVSGKRCQVRTVKILEIYLRICREVTAGWSSGMAAIAVRMLVLTGAVTENRAPLPRTAAITAAADLACRQLHKKRCPILGAEWGRRDAVKFGQKGSPRLAGGLSHAGMSRQGFAGFVRPVRIEGISRVTAGTADDLSSWQPGMATSLTCRFGLGGSLLGPSGQDGARWASWPADFLPHLCPGFAGHPFMATCSRRIG